MDVTYTHTCQRRWGSSGWPRGVGVFLTQFGGSVQHGPGWWLPQCPERCPQCSERSPHALRGAPMPREVPPVPREVPPCQQVLCAPLGLGLLQPCWNKGFPKKGASWRAKDSGQGLCVSPAGRLKSSAGKCCVHRSLPFSRAQLSARFPRAQIVQWVRRSWKVPSKAAGVQHPCQEHPGCSRVPVQG